MKPNAKDAALQFLSEQGWQEAGATPVQVTRTPFHFEHARITRTGGRTRLFKPLCRWRITIGPRTVCLYRIENGQAVDHRNIATRALAELADALKLIEVDNS